ncbi:MAG: DNA repair protein RadA [Butyrivibrio sp.]|nr:DNA repair protein RadA [Butyrivibrio sp.]
MAKGKNTAFFCKECGYESAKWMGQCPACHEWNTFVEEPTGKPAKGAVALPLRNSEPVKLSEVDTTETNRYSSGFGELDRVLGGGVVAGSMVLVGGDPGIGKSTILLQVCANIAKSRKVLYVSGEESLRQIKMRADRIGEMPDNFFLLCETNLASIDDVIRKHEPDTVVIDSIQTMYCESSDSAPGSVSQVRESTSLLMQIAKGLGITVFIVGHVTKEGVVAGPRVLEHMVDTVLYFEGERNESYRIIRAVKNRFGATNEIGVFEMCAEGLREVLNPSEYMLNGRPQGEPGSVVACLMEGTRPVLVEIQALVCHTNFGMPRRTAVGADYNRMNLLMAVLEKKIGMQLSSCDAYLNIAGGLKVNEPALDLGMLLAVISSFRNIPIPEKTIVFGEVGLTGEVRAVSQAKQRIAEAVKLGFEECILPHACLKSVGNESRIKLTGIKSVAELCRR